MTEEMTFSSINGPSGNLQNVEFAGVSDGPLRVKMSVKEIISEAVNRKATDIHIISTKRGHANIWLRFSDRALRHQHIVNAEAMLRIETIFAVARNVMGESFQHVRQGVLDSSSGLIPETLQMVRLQFMPQNNGRGTLIMRLIPHPNENEG